MKNILVSHWKWLIEIDEWVGPAIPMLVMLSIVIAFTGGNLPLTQIYLHGGVSCGLRWLVTGLPFYLYYVLICSRLFNGLLRELGKLTAK